MVQRRKTQALGFADVYEAYLDTGWTPLPLPRGEKFPPPKSYTGASRKQPRERDYRRWAADYPDGNVALVMPEGVVGVDVDVYHHGGETLKMLYRPNGPLPLVPVSTSRTDGSGISFYSVPPGTRLRGAAGQGIEIIQFHHRYAVVWPSAHPSGRKYQWRMQGEPVGVPEVSGLPELPAPWLRGLAGEGRGRAARTPYGGDAETWLAELRPGPMSLRVAAEVTRATGIIVSGRACRHDTMCHSLCALVRLGAQRQRGVVEAIDRLYETFCAALDGERDPEPEFFSALEWAIATSGGRK
jgi:Bifunctional DNA primase/polymerase, N-terminal